MCGIAGLITSNKNLDGGSIVSSMLETISHRGPDQQDYATFNDTTLGMVRLSIIDPKPHPIPIMDPSDRYAIVYNGEIYNHDSIRSSLASRYDFRTDSDIETALAAFIVQGVDSFQSHNGMYAFAIYDRVLRETVLVRDKAGEKPLYYTQGKDYIAFASEMKALLEIVEPQFNPEAASYDAYEFTVGKETLFKDIYALEPGEYLHIKDDRLSVHNYWKVWDNLIDLPDNENKVLDDLSELVEDSILLRKKNTSYEYATFLSGGVDSSLITCIAKPERVYTAHYDYADFDELDYAKMVAKQIGRELEIIKPKREDFIRTQDAIARAMDTPCTWTSFTLWMLMEKVAADGNKVVLTGDGADELFAGYHRYHLLHHDEQIHNLEAMQQYSYLIGKYYGSPVERYARLVNRSEDQYDKRVWDYLHQTIGYYYDVMGEDVVHFMGLNDFYSTMQVLLQMADRAHMAFSVENRSPFLDYRLIQFAFSMNSKFKIRDGVTKWALKEVARRFIPNEIVERKDKRGFSAPVNKWFQWSKRGKYDRSGYRQAILDDWKTAFDIRSI